MFPLIFRVLLRSVATTRQDILELWLKNLKKKKKKRKEKERKGKERKGKERKGKERKEKGENAMHTPVKFAWQAERPGSTHEAKSFTETHLLELWRSHTHTLSPC